MVIFNSYVKLPEGIHENPRGNFQDLLGLPRSQRVVERRTKVVKGRPPISPRATVRGARGFTKGFTGEEKPCYTRNKHRNTYGIGGFVQHEKSDVSGMIYIKNYIYLTMSNYEQTSVEANWRHVKFIPTVEKKIRCTRWKPVTTKH